MSATAENLDPRDAVQLCAESAGRRIAPTWPLDQLIAVNPWWEMRDQPLQDVAARVALLGHANGHMPRAWFREQFPGTISRDSLEAAATEAAAGFSAEDLIAWLSGEDNPAHWRNFSDQVDSQRDLERNVSWHDEIIHQISQFCASFYSVGTPLPAEPDRCLYEAWLDSVRNDRGIEIMMAARGLHAQFAALPESADALLAEAVETLGVPEYAMTDYFHALLLDVNGWASWVAYGRWQSALAGGSEDAMPQLLAVRLAWELVLWRYQHGADADAVALLAKQWQQQFERLPQLIARHRQLQQPAWIWQRAAELSYQRALHRQLLETPPAAASGECPQLQVALCIDVRSEVYRRALEAQDPAIQTLGFAGFFGLPIAYAPAASSYQRPQLPGLLSPALTVTESEGEGMQAERATALNRRARWSAISRAAPAAFGYVESVGLGYALNLLRESVFGADPEHPVNSGACQHSHYTLRNDDGPLDEGAQAALVAGILGAMTLTRNFAPTVILAGHGSSTRNNPHAAGLDCGACGGQTGELNVRVLVQLLNDPAVRRLLAGEHGIAIPEGTRFVAGLHDTTTDDLHCLTELPVGSEGVVGWLAAAGRAARRERAGNLGVDAGKADAAIRARSRDWSQVRPEWGLAGNAAFIVAPRDRVKSIDLEGRSFLHDYDWRADAANGYPVLELIMTAPMLVTHWINMQYNLSVIDNERYGSGNKVLHNVVGGNLGVFEGNGGDLRIGLPLQSLHDGERWMHETLRLSVYIDAPADAIADIAARHEVVRQLIDNDWLYLFRLDDEAGRVQRLYRGDWQTASTR
jgi:uncharacterized protein YbcC (UPF0753/DUF2309 family)